MIYIDCDNVLADFNKFVIQQTGLPYQGKDSWLVLENVDSLFLQLEPMQNARESVDNILNQQGYASVEILTALPLLTGKLVTSQRDKGEWIRKYIDEVIQVNCVSNWKDKVNFCRNPWDILIDDNKRNCDDWEGAGGTSVLHSNWEETNEELKRIGVI